MKLSCLITTLCVLQVSASGFSQHSRLNLNLRNTTVREVLKTIESKSDVRFFYNDDFSLLNKVVNISADQKGVEEILRQIFANSDFSYKEMSDNVVAIFPTSELQKKISGVVTDAKTGETLPGVSISIEGTSTGVVSDDKGQFFIDNPTNKEVTLVFSYVGYLVEKVTTDGSSFVNVKLVMSAKLLDDVVVVGYGVQKKESVVGAITQVDNKALMRSGTADVTGAIAGKLSGVLTIQQTGQPGSSNSEIIIRGLSSWQGSSPLVLVDGVERDFSDMDPNEINTISVLKDASATAVYGAKGANGVIIVTSKRGSLGKPQLSASASTGAQWATKIPNHISSYTTMSMYNVAMKNQAQFTDLIPQSSLDQYKNPSSPLNALQYPDNDWFNLLMKNFAPQTTANINLQGGTQFVKYFASLGYLYQGDLFKHYSDGGYDNSQYTYNRLNYRANLDFSLTKTTVLTLNVGGEVGIKNQPGNTPWYALYSASPGRYPAYFPDWVLQSVPDLNDPSASGIRYSTAVGDWAANPYTSIAGSNSYDRYNESKLFTDLVLNQKLDFITKGLSVNAKASLSTYYQTQDQTVGNRLPSYTMDFNKIGTTSNPWTRTGDDGSVYVLAPLDINIGGLQDNYTKYLYYEASVNYARAFGNHHVTGLALMNRSENDLQTQFPYYNEALVGRATYDFKRKYLLEANMGYTGSERFAPSNRFGFFPSVAVGWTASEEPFFKEAVPWMNKLKFRYSDGLTGSDKASSRWLYMSAYSTDKNGFIIQNAAANTNAQWEQARKRDFGTEIGLFKNLFSITVDLFDEDRSKMLLTPQSVTFLVSNSLKDLNLGKLKKHGLEVEVEFNKTTEKKLNYWVKGNFSFNENRILFKDDPIKTLEYQKAAGKPIGAQLDGVTLAGNGYYTSIDDIHNNPSAINITSLNVGDYKYCDYNADGTISNPGDKHAINGNLYAPVVFALSSGFNYKGWEFSFMLQGNYGKYIDFNENFENEFTHGNWTVHSSQLDYWTPTNLGANHSTLHFSNGDVPNLAWGGGGATNGYNTKIEGRLWRNSDYVRLKEVYLGYTFSSSMLKRTIGVSGMSLYATGNNLFTLTNLIEGDPERKDFYGGYYPQLCTVVFGVKLSF